MFQKIILGFVVCFSFSGCALNIPFSLPEDPNSSIPIEMMDVKLQGELRLESSKKFSPAQYFLYQEGEKIAQLIASDEGFLEYDKREVMIEGKKPKTSPQEEIPLVTVENIDFTSEEKEKIAHEKIEIEKIETSEEKLERLEKEKKEKEEAEKEEVNRLKAEAEKAEAEAEKETPEKEETTDQDLKKKKEDTEKLPSPKEEPKKQELSEQEKQRLLLSPTVLTATKKEINRISGSWTKITLYDGFADVELIDSSGEQKRIVYSYTTENKRVALSPVASYIKGENTSWKIETGTPPVFNSTSQVFVSGFSETSSVSSTIPEGYTTWYSKALKFQVAHPKAMYYDGSAVAGANEDFIARVDFAYKPLTKDNVEVRLEILRGSASGETYLNGVYTFPRDDSTRFRIYSPNTGNDELVKIMKELVVSTL